MKITDLKMNDAFVVKDTSSIVMAGGIAILPFDTVYGFVSDPKNEKALQKIYNLKKRPVQKTVGLAVSNISSIESIAEVNNVAKKYIKARTPGRYTFILKRKAGAEISSFCIRNDTVGVRIPDSKLILDIIDASGGIIAQTSANISGQGNCFSISDIKNQYSKDELNGVDLIVDGGKLNNSGASKLVDLTGSAPHEIERK